MTLFNEDLFADVCWGFPAWADAVFVPDPGPAPADARACAGCGRVPELVRWESYDSGRESFAALGGRRGVIARCTVHGERVAEHWTLVS